MNPLLSLHQQADAETQAYDQIEIVSTFGQPQAEYAAFHKAAALIDLPQRGFIELTGRDRLAFLNNLVTNPLYDKTTKTALAAGRVSYGFLLNLKGRIVLDLNVIELEGRTLLELDARLVAMLAKLLDKYLFAEQVKIVPQTGVLHEIALHGPRAMEVLAKETGIEAINRDENVMTKIIGVDTVLWRDDVCGAAGLHLILPAEQAAGVWQHLLTIHGGEYAVNKRLLRPAGWAAFNAVRIEAGRPLFGIDFELAEPAVPGKKAEAVDENAPRAIGVLPAETGLFERGDSVTKGCYLGQEIVARMHARGQQVARKLVGLRVDGGALPIAGVPVIDDKENQIGVITSSTMSPVLSDAAIALAFVKKPHFDIDKIVYVPAEGKMVTARVVPTPFVGRE
jgi:folate-binding protein YgfZ